MASTTKTPKPEAHALLGASSAHRWLNCPPSARLCGELPDTTSGYAREGTLAHELAALRLGQSFDPQLTKRSYTAACNKLLKDPAAGADMAGAVGEYVDLVKDTASAYAERPFIAIEQRVRYDNYAPEGFGTCDCLMIGRVSGPEGQPDYWQLRVMDYKHGKGVPVSAEHNPQLMLYALGALNLFASIYPIAEVALVICQPRLGSTTEWLTTPEDLAAWGESIRPIARQAFEGSGELREGDWCRFCKLGATCRARAARFTALEDFGYQLPAAGNAAPDRATLTDEELSRVLTIGARLDHWLKQLREYAQELLLGGGELPGWKMVEGRSVRAFADQPAAFELARAHGVADDLLYVREPVTLTALESLMGKKAFAAALESQIIRKPGKPALVPEGDPRPALSTASAAEDFTRRIM